MAVISDRIDTRVALVLNVGLDEKGNMKLSKKTYSRIKPAVTDEAIFNVANAIASLQDFELHGVERLDTNALDLE
ncbi:hypothetical protein BHU72_15010 [Desulfuribacillus stibiiarsenatis]|uniref:DUF1659 domain-containing protein n=1 Tax=Desulfuribacillus stibiiarsenatis TaxID=1390249 RepID=A0A1E5L608_9FIRM|nr:DUF1659 domain-containing protein [Desulfuribacillus stibiiarsenatis]OEH85565.1 hypothetical protein BHU72_15010 [Desulfuribacillus stibiiarsenatis]